MPNRHAIALAAAVALGAPANAAIVLTFEGAGNLAVVGDFYNGGTDSLGNSGADYGIAFSGNSLAAVDIDAGGSGSFANEPSPSTALFFQSGSAATMNIAAGFDTGFSFFYSSAMPGGFVTVYEGLDGTGDVLATIALAQQATDSCTGDPHGFYCNWTAVGVSFAGVARSVDFGGAADFIAFDDITIGSSIAGGIPEPATWAMMVGGFGLVGAAMRRRAKVSVSFA